MLNRAIFAAFQTSKLLPGNRNSGTGLDTSTYTGASNQDWDLFATVP
jgi:hypothetical protein